MLDVSTQANLLALVKAQMLPSGGAVLFISHDRALTDFYCDTVYAFDEDSPTERGASVKDYKKNMLLALVCFLLVVVLNFFLPRLLPGNPVAYLTGFSEQDMTPAQVAFYEDALHLNKPLAVQFGYYLRSLLDGTLGYSYKKDAAVSALIGEKIGYTLQITVPAVLLSAGIGLLWGLRCGYKKDSLCRPACLQRR